jgi:WD40 repeat protein
MTGDAVSSVEMAVFSGSGRRMATCGHSRSIRLWDPVEGVKIRVGKSSHPAYVTHVAASREGRRVVSGSVDGTLLVWRTDRPAPIATFKVNGVTSLAISPNGDSVVAGTDGSWDRAEADGRGRIVFWSLDEESGRREFEIRPAPTALRFSADGRFLAVAATRSEDPFANRTSRAVPRRIVVWDVAKEEVCCELITEREEVQSVQFGQHPDQLAGLSRRGRVALWDLSAGSQLASLDLKSRVAALGPQGNTAFVVRNVRDEAAMLVHCIRGRAETREWRLRLRRCGLLATSRADTVAVIGETASKGGVTRSLALQVYRSSTGELVCDHAVDAFPSCLAFSEDGRRLLAGQMDGTILVWGAR